MKKNQLLNAEVLLLSISLVFMGCSDSVPDGAIQWGGAFQINDVGAVIISQRVTATLSEGTFAAADAFTDATHPGYTVAHLPDGLTLSASRPTTTKVTFMLGGIATSPTASSTLGITFTDAAFSNNAAANVGNSAKTGIPITVGGLIAVESGPFTSTTRNTNVTIRLEGGTFGHITSLPVPRFTITTPGTGGFANLTGSMVWRRSDTEVLITGLTRPTTDGVGQKITVAGAAQATQATSVTVVAGN
jgi:hypothetical protein